MSVIDKVLAAVTPPVSEEKRAEATANARAVARKATGCGWSWTTTRLSAQPLTPAKPRRRLRIAR